MKAKDRKWDLNNLDDVNISDYLSKIIEYADDQAKFYEKGQRRRKRYSNTFLIIAILAFAFSLVFPIIKGPTDKIKLFNIDIYYYSVSYLSLVIASVFMLFDRLFGHS